MDNTQNITETIQQLLVESLRTYLVNDSHTLLPNNRGTPGRTSLNRHVSNARTPTARTTTARTTTARTQTGNRATNNTINDTYLTTATSMQTIHMVRNLIESNTTALTQYNAVMTNHIQNTRELIDIIRILLGQSRNSEPIIPELNRRTYRPSDFYTRLRTPLYQPRFNQTQFTDVVIRPTQLQIDNATEIITYHDSIELLNTQCPITMADFQDGDIIRRIHQCRHSFNNESILGWFRENVRCPVCRFDIREHVNDTNNEPDDNNETETDDQPELEHNINLEDSISNLLRTALSMDISNNTMNNMHMLSFEIPVEYDEYYDESNNVIGRGNLTF